MSAINIRNVQEVRRRSAGARVGRRTGEGLITSYTHHNGKLGVLVEVNCETDFVARTDEFKLLARQLAEHIAAAAPVAVDRDQMPADLVERKRQSFEEQVRALGKPEHLAPKIVDGKMEAYFRDVVLMDQEWVREPKVTIGALVAEVSVKTGEAIRVRRFARFHMGIA
jgi:elongation factor Ts